MKFIRRFNRGQLVVAAWFAGAALIQWANPLPQPLDLAAIAAIAGLIVVVLSVTASVVLLLNQHLSERYPRVLLLEVRKLGPWIRPLVGQTLAVVFIVTFGIFEPVRTTGLAALVLLVMVLVQVGENFDRLLDLFDASKLTTLIGDDWVRQFGRRGATSRNLESASDPLLSLAESAAIANDPTVVRAALGAFATLVGIYVDRNITATWGDSALQQTLNRIGDLPERTAGLAVTVLPSVADGIGTIGLATAGRSSPFASDSDDVTPRLMRMLLDIAAGAARHPNSVAPWQAATAMFAVARSCVEHKKLATASYAISLGRTLIQAAPPGGEHLTGPTLYGLLETALAYTGSDDPILAQGYVGDILDVFASAGEATPAVSLRQLVLPLADVSMTTLYLSVLKAGDPTRQPRWHQRVDANWDRLADRILGICLNISRMANQEVTIRHDAMDCAVLALIGELSESERFIRHFEGFSNSWKAVAVAFQQSLDSGLHFWDTFNELVLSSYVKSRESESSEVAKQLRTLVIEWLAAISNLDRKQRHSIAATARIVGASAIGHGDGAMAEAAARSVGASPSFSGSKAIHIPEEDLFTSGHFGAELFITPIRRGVPSIELGEEHDRPANRKALLELVASLNTPPRRDDNEEDT